MEDIYKTSCHYEGFTESDCLWTRGHDPNNRFGMAGVHVCCCGNIQEDFTKKKTNRQCIAMILCSLFALIMAHLQSIWNGNCQGK